MKDFFKKLLGGGASEQQVTVQGQQVNVNDLIEQAKQMAEQSRSSAQVNIQQVSVSELMAQMGAVSGAADTSAPKTQFVKKTQCHLCGGAKSLPPKTAYVYCDFCGGLTDYDFQKACENPQAAMPGPAYEELVRSMQADMAAAQQSKDADKYRAIQRSLFGKWVELCPNAVSPRAKDAEYRDQLIDYMAETAVLNNFDAKYMEYAETIRQQTAAIKWTGAYPKTTASDDTFWPLYKTVREQVEYSFSILGPAGILAKHPDEAPEELQKRMTWSMFCQGWIPWLTAEDSERMIADVGLKGEYTAMEPKETTMRHCGGCGGELHIIPGAKAVLCEDCGTRVDVSSDEVNCSNCGGMISFPVGKNRVNCPFCKTEARRMGW